MVLGLLARIREGDTMRGVGGQKPLPMVRSAKGAEFNRYVCAHCGWSFVASDGNEKNYIGTLLGDPLGPMCWDCWIKYLAARKP